VGVKQSPLTLPHRLRVMQAMLFTGQDMFGNVEKFFYTGI
jgi:hypothetical protein